MNNPDKITLGLIIFLLIVQFFFPLTTISGNIVTAHQAFLKYYNLHWSFYYFIFMISVILVGSITFFLTLKQKFRKYHSYTSWIWLIAIIGLFFFGASLESYLESQNLWVGDKYSAMNLIPSVIILLLIILSGLLEIMRKDNKKAVKEKKEPMNLKKIMVISIAFPLSTFIGIKIGLGTLISGVIGGVISYCASKILIKSKLE